MKQLAAAPHAEFALVVLNGPEKGATYKLVGGRVTLGRGSENNIVIKDDLKVSRNHALIVVGPRGAEISDVSDKNVLIVNGEQVSSCPLKPGSTILLGNTKFQFKSLGAQALDLAGRDDGLSRSPSSSRRRSGGNPQQNKIRFYMIVGAVILLAAWLMSSKQNLNPKVDIRTTDDIDATLQSNQKTLDELEMARKSEGLDSQQYKDAQPNFIKGFRDYRKGQYERAIESFQACLSLFPQHIQCERYRSLSLKKFNELVQYHMILAGKYKEQGQFSACKSAYRNVMVMLKDKTNVTYKEAQLGHDLCEAMGAKGF